MNKQIRTFLLNDKLSLLVIKKKVNHLKKMLNMTSLTLNFSVFWQCKNKDKKINTKLQHRSPTITTGKPKVVLQY